MRCTVYLIHYLFIFIWLSYRQVAAPHKRSGVTCNERKTILVKNIALTVRLPSCLDLLLVHCKLTNSYVQVRKDLRCLNLLGL